MQEAGKRPKQRARRKLWSKAQLDELIEQAIVDAYGESEQRVAFSRCSKTTSRFRLTPKSWA